MSQNATRTENPPTTDGRTGRPDGAERSGRRRLRQAWLPLVLAYLVSGPTYVQGQTPPNPPTVEITANEDAPYGYINNRAFAITIVWSETVSTFNANYIRLENSELLQNSLRSLDTDKCENTPGGGDAENRCWTARIRPLEEGPIRIEIPADSASTNTTGDVLTVIADFTPPVVTINAPSTDVTGPFDITIRIDEDTRTAPTNNDIRVTNGTAIENEFERDPPDGNVYTARIAPSSTGAVIIEIPAGVVVDLAGNDNQSTSIVVNAVIEAQGPEITTDGEEPVNGPFRITITFDVPVTGFDESDLMVENGTVSEFEGSGNTYTALVTPTSDGTVTISIPANAAEDDERNQTGASNILKVEADLTAPIPVITSDAATPVTRPFTITVTFNEVVNDFTIDDIKVEHGTISEFQSVDSGTGSIYTARITPELPEHGTDSITISIAEGAATDEAGNESEAAEDLVINADTAGPIPVITTDATPPVTAPFTITITFAEPVTRFTIGDLVVTGGSVSDFDGEETEYTALITPDESGTVTIDIPAGAGLNEVGYPTRTATPFTISSDTVAPTATITTTDETHPPVKEPFGITIAFSEDILGFGTDDIIVTLGEAKDLAVLASENPTDPTTVIAVITPDGSGTLRVEIPPGSFTDVNGLENTEAVVFEILADTVPPTVQITTESVAPVTGRFEIAITFSETVTGFTQDDIEFPGGNGWVVAFLQTGDAGYTAIVNPHVTGAVDIRIPEAAAVDRAQHPTDVHEFSIIAYLEDDVQGAKPTIRTTATAPVRGPFPVNIYFTEDVIGFETGDLVIGNGQAGEILGRGDRYTSTIWPDTDGEVTIDIPDGVAEDLSGNPSRAADQFSIMAQITVVPALPTAGLILMALALAALSRHRLARHR